MLADFLLKLWKEGKEMIFLSVENSMLS